MKAKSGGGFSARSRESPPEKDLHFRYHPCANQPVEKPANGVRSVFDKEIMDQLSVFFERHKALEATFVCMLVSLLNFWTAFPIEWLFFLYFTFTIFVQALEVGMAVFIVLSTVIVSTDILIFLLLPYRQTTFLASFIVHTFLIYGMHGFGLSLDMANFRGWLLLMSMILLRFTVWNPWFFEPPPTFMSPIAAHCTGFGICYTAWKTYFYAYKEFNTVASFFGILIPESPIITIREITDTSISVSWSQLVNPCFASNRTHLRDEKKLPDDPGGHAETKFMYSKSSSPFHHSSESSSKFSRKNTPFPISPEPMSSLTTVDSATNSFLIDVNGDIIGESTRDETSAIVMGLIPDTLYRIRVWACAARKRVKCPSPTVLVRTARDLPSRTPTPIARNLERLSNPQLLEDGTALSILPSPSSTPDLIKENAQVRTTTTEDEKIEVKKIENDLDSLRRELTLTRRQVADVYRSIQEAEDAHLQEEQSLKEEIAKVKESRKLGDGGRSDQKSRLKQLEDSKKEADSRRSKLEKLTKGENSARESARGVYEKRMKELGQLKDSLNQAEATTAETHETHEKRLTSSRANIKEQQELLKQLSGRLEVEHVRLKSGQEVADSRRVVVNLLKQRIRIMSEMLDNVTANRTGHGRHLTMIKIDDKIDGKPALEEMDRAISELERVRDELDIRHIELMRTFAILHEEHRVLEETLRDESRDKMRLLRVLTSAKRETGDLRLVSPTSDWT
ncbi:hypothetical protein BJ742DRAFT_791999 [Cladochytrium replicatum]|nr:hypothetical protein BJ742DRAFT_791999 [Cladochytrium replicatum]